MPIRIVIFVFVSGLANGQANVRISGRVVDPTGAAISNATVRLKLAAPDGATDVAHSGWDGAFSFPAKTQKTYELTFESAGFTTIVKTIHTRVDTAFDLRGIVMSVASIFSPMLEGKLFVQGIKGTSAAFSKADLARSRIRPSKARPSGLLPRFKAFCSPMCFLKSPCLWTVQRRRITC